MAHLDKEQIGFIDHYLENSDIIHVDIRAEMVDHVASGIEERINDGDERDFYYIFKDYMVAHKARLLDNNKKFLRAIDLKILKAIGKVMLSWQGLTVFLGVGVLTYLLQINFDSVAVKYWIIGLPIIGFILFALAYILSLKLFKLDRFSAVERIGVACNLLFLLFHVFRIFSDRHVEENDPLFISVMITLSITLLFALVKVTINMATSYQNRFKEFV